MQEGGNQRGSTGIWCSSKSLSIDFVSGKGGAKINELKPHAATVQPVYHILKTSPVQPLLGILKRDGTMEVFHLETWLQKLNLQCYYLLHGARPLYIGQLDKLQSCRPNQDCLERPCAEINEASNSFRGKEERHGRP